MKGLIEPYYSNDIQLWQAFKKGDKQAFAYIYHIHFNLLYTYAFKISQQENLAKDCVQEVFVYLWTNRSNLADVTSIKAYLLICLRRKVVRQLQEAKKENLHAENFLHNSPDICFSSEEFIIHEQQQDLVREHLISLLNQLPKRRREAIYLKYYKNLSYQEIAMVMSLSEKAVINHVYKAFKALRNSKLLNKVADILIVSALLLLSFLLPFMT